MKLIYNNNTQKQKLIKECENITQHCEEIKKQASKQLIETKQQYETISKWFHTCLDKLVILIDNKSQHSITINEQDTTILLNKSLIDDYENQKQQLMTFVQEW